MSAIVIFLKKDLSVVFKKCFIIHDFIVYFLQRKNLKNVLKTLNNILKICLLNISY